MKRQITFLVLALLPLAASAGGFQTATVLRTGYSGYLVKGTSHEMDVIELRLGNQIVTVNWRPFWAFGHHASAELVVGSKVQGNR